MNKAELEAVQTLWSFMQQRHTVPKYVDVMAVLGSRDDRVAGYAADLLAKVEASYVILTGGVAHQNDLLAPPAWKEGSEAEHFAAVMRAEGYDGVLHIEPKAQNTGDNAQFSGALFQQLTSQEPSSLLIVTKPYMELRALRTFEKQWTIGNPTMYVASTHESSLHEYLNDSQTYDDIVNLMVGDMKRIIDYPSKGFMTVTNVPKQVLVALEYLIQQGYTKHL